MLLFSPATEDVIMGRLNSSSSKLVRKCAHLYVNGCYQSASSVPGRRDAASTQLHCCDRGTYVGKDGKNQTCQFFFLKSTSR